MTFRPRTNTKAAAAAAASFLVVSLWLLGCCSCSSFVIVVRDCYDCRVGFWLLTADGKLLIDLLSLLSFFLFLSFSFLSVFLGVCQYIFLYSETIGATLGKRAGERKKGGPNYPGILRRPTPKGPFLLPRQFGQRSNSFKCIYVSRSRGSTPHANQKSNAPKGLKKTTRLIPSARPVNGTAQLSALHQYEHPE